jgi:5-formaminoimidazole-4-carboxamide-1-(beta)-D-ribofuranosyl 5'-monophosphate synthetase
MNIPDILTGYDVKNLTVGVLGGHSGLDVCHGAKQHGFKTVCVARKGREKTYDRYFKTRGSRGCIDETIVVENFSDVLDTKIQKKLQSLNTTK